MKNIVFDLDGTILEEDKTISLETFECIKQLSNENIITVATGRSMIGIPSSLVPIHKFISYIITSNGTTIYDSNRKVIYKDRISFEEASAILARIIEIPHTIVEVLADGDWHIFEKDAERFQCLGLSDSVLQYIKKTRIKHKNLIKYINDSNTNVEKFSVNICDASFTDEIFSHLDCILNDYNLRYFSENPHKIDIFKSNVSKSKALQFLSEFIGISLENTVAFGNDDNDVDMFKACGKSICMPYATKEARLNSDIVLRKNDSKRIMRAVNYLRKQKEI